MPYSLICLQFFSFSTGWFWRIFCLKHFIWSHMCLKIQYQLNQHCPILSNFVLRWNARFRNHWHSFGIHRFIYEICKAELANAITRFKLSFLIINLMAIKFLVIGFVSQTILKLEQTKLWVFYCKNICGMLSLSTLFSYLIVLLNHSKFAQIIISTSYINFHIIYNLI
jgi:hypothetical protein